MSKKNNQLPTKKAIRKKSVTRKFRWWRFILKLFTAGIILFFLLVFIVYLGFLGKVPSSEELARVRTPLASEVFSSKGKVLGRYYIQNRSYASFKEISPNIIHALVATEDARFYKHRGIDEFALLRVIFKTILLRDRSSGGGSTLSQQIAKNIYPREEFWMLTIPVGKIREAIIAYRLEKIYSKEEILALYLNTVPFGENIFGIEVAAERFFSKKPSEVTVPEAAVLVGILKANNVFNPRLHPDKSVQRRNVVLDQMVKQKFLSKALAEKYKASPLNLKYSLITYNQGPAPYFLEYLRPSLMAWCRDHTGENGEPYNLFTDGLKIYTTLDEDLQAYARNAVREQMKVLQAVFDAHWKNQTPWGDDPSVLSRAVRLTDRYKKGVVAGWTQEQIMKSFNQSVEMTLFTWEGLKTVKATPMDSVRHYLSMLNTGFVVLENKSGAIKAWIGGDDYRFFKYDHCTAARQAGSTFKTMVYLAALENGLSPLDYYSSEQQSYSEYDGWSPGNASDHYSGYYTMKAALAKSINTVTVDIMMQTGVPAVIRTARDLGITAKLPEVPSLALGVASVPLIEMVSAYASIANLGTPLQPWSLVKIENSKGELLEAFKIPPAGDSKLDPENCRIIIHMLQSAIDEGTGLAIRSKYNVPGQFAGKTGTTQDFADGWFIGFSPDFTAGCWVGADDPAIHFRTLTYGQGAFQALPTVGKFFSKMYADNRFSRLSQNRFESPDSLTIIKLNELPDHVDQLERDFNFFEIFKRKTRPPGANQKEEILKKEEKKPQKEVPVWEKIKDIFKKR